MTKKDIASFCIGILIGGALVHLGTPQPEPTNPYDTDVHVHSDFIVYVDSTYVDLSLDAYQTSSLQELHADIHLHDNDGKVIHRHAEDITLGMFFSSLNIPLTDTCITTTKTYCTDSENSLLMYVNGEQQTDIENYINAEEDQILIYYGDPESEIIPQLQSEIEDRSCIFSGTCPERGIAPPESCGLTCEL